MLLASHADVDYNTTGAIFATAGVFVTSMYQIVRVNTTLYYTYSLILLLFYQSYHLLFQYIFAVFIILLFKRLYAVGEDKADRARSDFLSITILPGWYGIVLYCMVWYCFTLYCIVLYSIAPD